MEISFEIPQGYYTKQELESYIQNRLSKIGNTPINAYSSTEGNMIYFLIMVIKKN